MGSGVSGISAIGVFARGYQFVEIFRVTGVVVSFSISDMGVKRLSRDYPLLVALDPFSLSIVASTRGWGYS